MAAQIELASISGNVTLVEPGPRRIADLAAVYDYISYMDFSAIKGKLTSPALANESPIEEIHADFCELHYKRWLFLRRKHEGKVLPPTRDIDVLWHAHILDTCRYHEDCELIFGYYLHHHPSFGVCGDKEAANFNRALKQLAGLYKEEFKAELPIFM